MDWLWAIFSLLQQNELLFLLLVVFAGLIAGSFLNVVIFRLPIMMQRQWRHECYQCLELSAPDTAELKQTYNLLMPRSCCPYCNQLIRAWENIPILSFLYLRGRCRGCGGRISWQYPVVEILAAVLALAAAMQFGLSWQLLPALFFSWSLLCLAGIDANHKILPDHITLPLVWAGLLVNSFALYTDLHSSLIGAVVGYLVLWGLYHGYKWLRGKEGLGYGDFKLLAALGAWTGWQMLPLVILIASVAGSCFALFLLLGGKYRISATIPFGPWLALAGWIAFIWGSEMSLILW